MYLRLKVRREGTGVGIDPKMIQWDPTCCGERIALSDDNKRCYLRESNYCFRSVVTNFGFSEGVHYWEVVCDSASGNELKVGVTSKRNFNLDTVSTNVYRTIGLLRL